MHRKHWTARVGQAGAMVMIGYFFVLALGLLG